MLINNIHIDIRQVRNVQLWVWVGGNTKKIKPLIKKIMVKVINNKNVWFCIHIFGITYIIIVIR